MLEIEWHHRVPPAPTFRTAWEDALGGRAFVVGQWYPQVATYDVGTITCLVEIGESEYVIDVEDDAYGWQAPFALTVTEV